MEAVLTAGDFFWWRRSGFAALDTPGLTFPLLLLLSRFRRGRGEVWKTFIIRLDQCIFTGEDEYRINISM